MRVHRLELAAFGPFPGTEVIDFDELNDAGVFLLTGPTGAGKTSILDAICFGLFGSVPGDRNNAKDLRSHHAAPDVVPYVELEVTMRGRRFRLRRSPTWTKPSRRAKKGFVEQNAQARAAELVDGEWVPRSSRVDEVGHLVTRVLGMSRDQFCQVVMLPQGEFQTFLKAGAKERHDVLEALFETGRFVRIEKWLGDRRRHAEQACSEHEAILREQLARLEEANDGPLTQPAADQVDAAVSWGDYAAAAEVLRGSTAGAVVDARAAEEQAHTAVKTATHALDVAKTLAARQARYVEARDELASLDAMADIVRSRQEAVTRARAAEALRPVLQRLAEAQERFGEASDRAAIIGRRLDGEGWGDLADADTVETCLAELQGRLAGFDGLRKIELEILELDRRLIDVGQAIENDRAALAALQQQAVEAPAQVTRALAELTESRRLADSRPEARRRAVEADSVLAAARECVVLDDEVGLLRLDADIAREQALMAREHWLAVRERYLDSLAAVLAARLVSDSPCPVCGSATHPEPAAAADGHTSADEEAAALAALTAADQRHAEMRDAVDAAIRRHSVIARQARGLSIEEALAAAKHAAADVAVAESAADDLQRLTGLVEQVTHLMNTLDSSASERSAAIAANEALAVDWASKRTVLHESLVREIGTGTSATQQIDAVQAQIQVATSLLKALRDTHDRAAMLVERQEQLDGTLAHSPFEGADEIASAAMTRPEIANDEALIRAAADRRAAALHTLAEPALVQAVAAPPPELDQLVEAVDLAHEHLQLASTRANRLAERLARFEHLGSTFVEAVAGLGSREEARDLATRVASMVAGTSADNQTRTKLSHYVLSARLQQVVEAANSRLGSISAGRYQLEHQMARGVGDTRGGLGLAVHDTYSGHKRDPATLSGGETFYVSLALALGLADLIRDEIGGVELSTLFVDEGFGSLDSDTLDEVMDELDSLRSGGRSVGIVSHLAELRQRIPTRVHVTAGTAGSRVESS
jgi:exonuclease SbcC